CRVDPPLAEHEQVRPGRGPARGRPRAAEGPPTRLVVAATSAADRLIALIVGPPGSGKGTQAARIGQEFGLTHLSSGDILRAEAKGGGELGREATKMARGELVPDDLVDRIVES